jgi:monomeric isocitrate dehydrogenase
MRAWKPDAKTCVASMTDGDFYSSEKSHIMPKVTVVNYRRQL